MVIAVDGEPGRLRVSSVTYVPTWVELRTCGVVRAPERSRSRTVAAIRSLGAPVAELVGPPPEPPRR